MSQAQLSFLFLVIVISCVRAGTYGNNQVIHQQRPSRVVHVHHYDGGQASGSSNGMSSNYMKHINNGMSSNYMKHINNGMSSNYITHSNNGMSSNYMKQNNNKGHHGTGTGGGNSLLDLLILSSMLSNNQNGPLGVNSALTLGGGNLGLLTNVGLGVGLPVGAGLGHILPLHG